MSLRRWLLTGRTKIIQFSNHTKKYANVIFIDGNKHDSVMNLYKSFFITIALFTLVSCANEASQNENASSDISTSVDALNRTISNAIALYEWQLSLDHHRMAQKEGAYTPPAIATIFSDAQINAKILENNDQLIALDLPFKFLAYSEPDAVDASLAYTSADFIAKRHDLPYELLADYSGALASVLNLVDESVISETNTEDIKKGFAIVTIKSDFDFEATARKLKETIGAIPDTIWFGELDYQKEAQAVGIELKPTRLLFFGAPEPGAKAMINTPKLGLDAFCQKLLIYENEKGEVWAAYNDITAFSELYYDKATVPQRLIERRLKSTISNTVERE